jgi:hypothetical protein
VAAAEVVEEDATVAEVKEAEGVTGEEAEAGMIGADDDSDKVEGGIFCGLILEEEEKDADDAFAVVILAEEEPVGKASGAAAFTELGSPV